MLCHRTETAIEYKNPFFWLLLPIAQSFGFTGALRAATHAKAFPQTVFSLTGRRFKVIGIRPIHGQPCHGHVITAHQECKGNEKPKYTNQSVQTNGTSGLNCRGWSGGTIGRAPPQIQRLWTVARSESTSFHTAGDQSAIFGWWKTWTKDMVVVLACVHERGRAAVVGDNWIRETNVSLVR